MSLPDSFPKRFTITIGIQMDVLMDAGITEWGKVLARHFHCAEVIAVEQIKDFRQRYRVFQYCGADPGEGFKTDLNCAWVTTDDGMIQFLRMDMIPVGEMTLTVHVGLMVGTHEEVEKDGVCFVREVKKKD